MMNRMELPPRARRIPAALAGVSDWYRTTSACAENTPCDTEIVQPGCELPPRARRIRWRGRLGNGVVGTSSACAENTGPRGVHYRQTRNYLRVRGEYMIHRFHQPSNRELPPRARRILHVIVPKPHRDGTTSACAENTQNRGRRCVGIEELPPRARRIRHSPATMPDTLGTTSACAENTLVVLLLKWICGNYLRVRGEYHPTGSSYR